MRSGVIALAIMFLLCVSVSGVAYPGGFFRGPIDMMGHNLNNATNLNANITKVTNLGTWLGTNATKITNTQAYLGTNVTKIGNLQTWLGTNATKANNALSWLALNKTRVDTLESYKHISTLSLGSPIVDTVDYVKAVQTWDDSGPWTLSTFAAQPDIPRSLSVNPAGTISGTFAFTGTNAASATITETLTFAASSTAQETARAFKTVTSCVVTKTGGANSTYTIGIGGKFGLGIMLTDSAQVVAASINNVRESTYPTLTVSSGTLSLNTVDLQSATAGTAVKVYVMV